MFARIILILFFTSSVYAPAYATDACGRVVEPTYATFSDFGLAPHILDDAVQAPGDFLRAWRTRHPGIKAPFPLRAEYYAGVLAFFLKLPERIGEVPNLAEDHILQDLTILAPHYLWMRRRALNPVKEEYTVRDVYEVHVAFAEAMRTLVKHLASIDPDPEERTLRTNAGLRQMLTVFREREAVLRVELAKRLKRDGLPPAKYSDEDLELIWDELYKET